MRRTALALAALLAGPLLSGCLTREIKQPPAGGATAFDDSDLRSSCGFRIWSGGYYDRDRAWNDGHWVCLEHAGEHASGSAEPGAKAKKASLVRVRPETPTRTEVDVDHGDRRGHH